MTDSRVGDRYFGLLRSDASFRYALAGARVLAGHRGAGPLGVDEVAARCGVPTEFLAKIFTRLARTRLLTSRRGPGGGFALGRAPESISLAEIFRAVAGRPGEPRPCLLGHGDCDGEHPCAMHAAALGVEAILVDKLETLTLADDAAS